MPTTPTIPITPGAHALANHWRENLNTLATTRDIPALRREEQSYALLTVTAVQKGDLRSVLIFADLSDHARKLIDHAEQKAAA
ncbi:MULTISPECIES: hypothetical protein [unclassified Microbacterium]|uniref:hypothetical protein n=1 Tax=unclassified Microbacterium TaxID=2609290 RepID=UPI00386426B9